MADTSLDIILSAVDATGPATASAIANLNNFAQAADSAGNSGGTGIGDLLTDLVSVGTVLGGLPLIAGLAGAAIATNFGGIRDVISDVLSAGAQLVGQFATYIIDTVAGAGSSIVDTIQSIMDGTFDWDALLTSVVNNIVTAFAILEFTFKNFGAVATYVFTGMELGLERFASYVEYVFLEVIPTVIQKASGNVKGAFATFQLGLDGLLGRTSSNDTIMSAVGFAMDLDSALPDRKISELEKQLQSTFDDLGAGIGEGMAENITKRLEAVPAIKDLIKSAPGKIGEFVGDLKNSGILQSLFGQGEKQVNLALPSLANERFTTGVNAAGQEDLMLAEQRKATSFLEKLAVFVDQEFGTKVAEGVREGVDQAKKYGVVLK